MNIHRYCDKIAGLKKQGVKFTVYSIYAVGVYSFVAWLITDVLPVDVSMVSPLAGSDLLLCVLFGGMISGTGSGLTMRWGGAMDDIDVLAVIFAKAMGISVGSFVMIYNVWFVVNRFQITKLKDIVHRIDPAAYITLHEVADVFKANQ